MATPGKAEPAMSYVRILWPLAAVAALAACSGSLGGGQSTLPGAPQTGTNVQQVAPPTPTASPVSASNVATVGDTISSQPLPTVMGWSGTITFPKPSAAPSPSPNAKSTPAASTAAPGSPVSIGVTAAVVDPPDAPHFGSAAGKARRGSGKHADPTVMQGLFFISLLSTADVTLGEYPKIAVEVPREVASKFRDDTFALALYDPDNKSKTYQLAVAERNMASPGPSSTSTLPTAAPVATAAPTGPPANGSSEMTPPPVGSGLDAATLPPEHVAFLGTAATLTLKANRPVVFALYAVPPQPSPSPSAASGTRSSPAASPTPVAGSSPSTSPVPPTALPSPAGR